MSELKNRYRSHIMIKTNKEKKEKQKKNLDKNKVRGTEKEDVGAVTEVSNKTPVPWALVGLL